MATVDHYEHLKLSAGGFIAPAITLALLVIAWRMGLKWVTVPALVLLIIFYLAMPRLVRIRANRFHRNALRMLAGGNAAQVPKLAKRQFILQLFGPSAPIDAKLGLAYSQMGNYPLAIPCLQNAIPDAPPNEMPALRSALAKALFVIGDPARAEVEGRQLLDKGIRLAETLVLVARARMGLGKMGNPTPDYLKESLESSPSEDVKTMVLLSNTEAAVFAGRRFEDLPAQLDSNQRFVRVWINLVRGLVREKRGDTEAAVASYSKAVKEGAEENCWFANLAYQRLERLRPGKKSKPPIDTTVDPAIKRKRKRRR